MRYPLVRELTFDGIPVTVTCRVLKLARQPYYRWLSSPVTDAEITEAYLATALFDAHRDDPKFGYRFLADERGRRLRRVRPDDVAGLLGHSDAAAVLERALCADGYTIGYTTHDTAG